MSGTVTAATGCAHPPCASFSAASTRLFHEAEELGLAPTLVASLVNARAARGRSSLRPLRLVMVGNFIDTTQQYVDSIRQHLNAGDTIVATTVQALEKTTSEPLPYDLCVTLAHRRGEVESLLPAGIPVVGLSFIPAEETRALLAVIDPMARIGIVSIFPEFMALMKPGVLRFTPHVSDAEVRLITAPDLKAFLFEPRRARLCERGRAHPQGPAGWPPGDRISICSRPTRHSPNPDSGNRALAHRSRHQRGRAFMKISDMNWLQVEAIPEDG